jgi:hypothetical protein
MIEHTPTHWHYQENSDAYTHIVRSGDRFIFQLSQDTSGEAEATARFIVKAVNSHDALVKALTLAEDVLSRRPFSTEIWPNGMHPQEGIEQIRAALASIKEPEMMRRA